MSDTPDLSKIIGLIMNNPSLISEISKIAGQSSDMGDEEPKQTDRASAAIAPAEGHIPTDTKRERRHKLLQAMKPYLKSERANALDTLTSILEVFQTVKGG